MRPTDMKLTKPKFPEPEFPQARAVIFSANSFISAEGGLLSICVEYNSQTSLMVFHRNKCTLFSILSRVMSNNSTKFRGIILDRGKNQFFQKITLV